MNTMKNLEEALHAKLNELYAEETLLDIVAEGLAAKEYHGEDACEALLKVNELFGRTISDISVILDKMNRTQTVEEQEGKIA